MAGNRCSCCWCWFLWIFIISFIIGTPCLIYGCSNILCPLYEPVDAVVTESSYQHQTCQNTHCGFTQADGTCFFWVTDEYDCSFYVTTVQAGSNTISCGTGSNADEGTHVYFLLRKYDNTCLFDIEEMKRVSIVGILFMSLSGICLFLTVLFLAIECRIT